VWNGACAIFFAVRRSSPSRHALLVTWFPNFLPPLPTAVMFRNVRRSLLHLVPLVDDLPPLREAALVAMEGHQTHGPILDECGPALMAALDAREVRHVLYGCVYLLFLSRV
jgi:hypothetical protein